MDNPFRLFWLYMPAHLWPIYADDYSKYKISGAMLAL